MPVCLGNKLLQHLFITVSDIICWAAERSSRL